jgi:heptosyltransferase-2
MEKFLIIQTAFLGDAILTLPMIQKLKELNPDCLIDVIAIPQTAVIFSHSASVNEVYIFDKHGKHRSVLQTYRFGKFIAKRNYVRIYSPHRSVRTSLLVMLSRVKETYGFDLSALSHIYKYRTEYKKGSHEVERNLHLIQTPAENNNWRILPELNIPEEAQNKIDSLIEEIGSAGNFAAIAPGSIWSTKRYPKEYMEKILRYLADKFDMVFIIGGELDIEICEELESKVSGRSKSLAGKLSLIDSVALLKNVNLLVSNDSAPAHLGMCADIPVLMIYCSTVPDFGFYPYNRKSYFLSFDDLFCKPCGIHGFDKCPLGNFACGYNLKPEIVIKKIEEMINV